MQNPGGPTYPNLKRFNLRSIVLVHAGLFAIALLSYFIFRQPKRVLISNVSWEATPTSCIVTFSISNLTQKNLSGSLSIRALSLSGSQPSDINQASPFVVGQKNFLFTLTAAQSDLLVKEIPGFYNHGCDNGQIVPIIQNK